MNNFTSGLFDFMKTFWSHIWVLLWVEMSPRDQRNFFFADQRNRLRNTCSTIFYKRLKKNHFITNRSYFFFLLDHITVNGRKFLPSNIIVNHGEHIPESSFTPPICVPISKFFLSTTVTRNIFNASK